MQELDCKYTNRIDTNGTNLGSEAAMNRRTRRRTPPGSVKYYNALRPRTGSTVHLVSQG